MFLSIFIDIVINYLLTTISIKINKHKINDMDI